MSFSSGRNEDGTVNEAGDGLIGQKEIRLVDWNVEILSRLLRGVVARRQTDSKRMDQSEHVSKTPVANSQERSAIDEVKEIIDLPEYNALHLEDDPSAVSLDPLVVSQLREYVEEIAVSYVKMNNPFHNFEQ